MFGILDRADAIRAHRTVEHALAAAADLPLRVVAPDVTDHGIFDMGAVQAVIEAGDAAAMAALRDLAPSASPALSPPTSPAPQPPRRRPSDTRPTEVPTSGPA
jgi:hypothetical protein